MVKAFHFLLIVVEAPPLEVITENLLLNSKVCRKKTSLDDKTMFLSRCNMLTTRRSTHWLQLAFRLQAIYRARV